MSDYIALMAAALVAVGWSMGVLLVVLPFAGRLAPRGWALRELTEGKLRLVALTAGLVLLLAATALFLVVDAVRL